MLIQITVISAWFDSINGLERLIRSAHKKGLKGIAITDHEALSGHVKASKICKEIQKEFNTDFKVLCGNEIYLIDERGNHNSKYYHFLLIAKDQEGYRQLKELSSTAWMNSYTHKKMERVPTLYSELTDVVSKNKGHLIASTACLGSYFAQEVLNYLDTKVIQHKQNIHDFMLYMIDLFGDDFYIEIQPSNQEEQIEYNKMAVTIAKAYNVKWVATCDAHYVNKEDKPVHSAYLNSKDEEREVADFYSSTYLWTSDELLENLEYLGEDVAEMAISNSMEVWDKCSCIEFYQDIVVPERPLPESFETKGIFEKYYDQYNTTHIQRYMHSDYPQDRFLMSEIEKGFLNKNQEFNQENIERINIELEELWLVSEGLNQRLSSYYNLTQYIVNDIMWNDKKGNSLVGVSRGSVGGFYIAYLNDIIQINPIEHGLPHWRHLNRDKISLADWF